MPDILVFTLVAPMGAFGDLAGHERRGSTGWPGRSALLGLLGACLGVRREDRAGQEALKRWQTAVSVLTVGDVWRDFHTVQTVPAARIKQANSRAEALAELTAADNAIITRREYRSDCAFGVAVWGDDVAGLVSALRRPAFTPYLGRKSCPLTAPMAPVVVRDTDPVTALGQVQLPDFLAVDPAEPALIASDAPLGAGWTETRWDDPLDRSAWHFGPRTVHVFRKDTAP